RLDNRLTPTLPPHVIRLNGLSRGVRHTTSNRADGCHPRRTDGTNPLMLRTGEPNQEGGRGRICGSRHPLTLLPLPHLPCPCPRVFRGCRRIPRRAGRGYPWLAPCPRPRALPTQAGAR